jgi:bacterioferritin-associated ferredoxin
MYVCICAAVTEAELRSCISAGADTVEDVGDACGAGTGCGTCLDQVDTFLLAAHSPSELGGLPLTA